MPPEETGNCKTICTVAAVLLGAGAAAVVWFCLGWGGFPALVIGLIAAALLAWVFGVLFCRDAAAQAGGLSGSGMAAPQDPAPAAPAATATAATATAATAATATGTGHGVSEAESGTLATGAQAETEVTEAQDAAERAAREAARSDAIVAEGGIVEGPTSLADDLDAAGEHDAPMPAQATRGGGLGQDAEVETATDLARSGDGSDAAAAAVTRDDTEAAATSAVTPSDLSATVGDIGSAPPARTPSDVVSELPRDETVTPSTLSDAVTGDDRPRSTPSELADGVAGEVAPELFSAPPARVDDLKAIKGVGPGLERTLNEMGIFTFAQIAAWGPGEIAWVDARLKFKGRILRDSWVDQARDLTGGGAS